MNSVNTETLCGGVLAGGASRRMGSAKAFLQLEERSFLARTAAALAPVVDRVFILGTGDSPPDAKGWPRLADAPGVQGPLAGMLAAFAEAPHAVWIFAACDLPLVSPPAVRWLLAQRWPGCWAVLPRLGEDRVEPLLALYEPEARPRLEELARGPSFSLQPLAALPGIVTPTPPAALRSAWRNVNTPGELSVLMAELDR
ncbi:MAG: molybdenum cofactor guanylyltransferase [Acidobacteriota bacterium]